MKRTITFISFTLFLALYTFAGPISPEKALEIANTFWKENVTLKKDIQLQFAPASLVSKAPSHDRSQNSDSQYYIFNSSDNKGFVIVSGDDQLTPIIGYSDNEPVGDMPQALKDWLEAYSNYVDEVRSGIAEPTINNVTATIPNIAPMLKTSWNQSSPYNNYCPEVNGQKTPTGCTATAMAQIMKFHEHPAKPKKAISWYNNITGKTETIDITKNTYDWENMLPHYRNGYNATQADAVATLMWDVGRAISSSYSPSGTGSSDVYAALALVNVFDYSPEIVATKRVEYTYEEYLDLIIKNLQARQPILHTGHGPSYAAGHAFVCDGIDSNGMLHIDWGWDAAYNGYFDMGSMAPAGSGIGGGQDRYNVGQGMIFNIRPRTADESDRNGDPTLYSFEIANPNKNNEIVDDYTTAFSAGYARFGVSAAFLNWSHSTVNMQFGFKFTNEDGSVVKMKTSEEYQLSLSYNKAAGYYIDFMVNNSAQSNPDYLAEGTYNVEMFYQWGDSEPIIMRGDNARMTLNVGKNNATITKAKPQIEVTALQFSKKPEYQLDKATFDVAFRNMNKNNATVIVVPIINLLNGDKIASSDTLASSGIIMSIYDDTDVIMTYTLGSNFEKSGNYNITFAYDLRNSYTNHEMAIDKKRLKSIGGASETFEIKALPDGPRPQLTSVTAGNNVLGSNLNIVASIKNAAVKECVYSATIGLFAENDDEAFILASADVNLSMNAVAQLKFNSTDYLPKLTPGKYKLYVCELKEGTWTLLSSQIYSINLVAPESAKLYATRINVGNGNVVMRGDSVDVKFTMGCMFNDFDGYVRVNVLNGLTMVLRSDYIPMTLNKDQTSSVNLRSMCNTKAPLGEWNIVIKYYDKNKRELGSISKNTMNYPDNGVFLIHDATSIDNATALGLDVSVANGTVVVCGAEAGSEVTIYTTNGRTIYSGTATDVAVESGIYIVTIKTPTGNIVKYKVFVR